MEAYHRQTIHTITARKLPHYCLQLSNTCPHYELQELAPIHTEDFCNKSVPIYVINGHPSSGPALPHALHNWLYHKWHQPYRNDIEYGQFIAKVIFACPPPVGTPTPSLVELVNKLNKTICNQVSTFQKEAMTLPTTPEFPGWPCFRDQRFLILQPLFKALTIILLENDFMVFIADMGKLPVLLTLTGQDHGLSQPLSFDSISHHVQRFVSKTAIQVPLSRAIEFVLAQQKREIAVFDQQPDPVESTRGLQNGLNLSPEGIDLTMRQLGWSDQPIEGPSSKWVDTEIYTDWTGVSVREDKSLYQLLEDRERFRMLCKVAGVDHNSTLPRRRHSF